MRLNYKKIDMLLTGVLILIIIGLPLAIRLYDNVIWQARIPAESKIFTLTGHTKKGWVLGEINAVDVITSGISGSKTEKPVLNVTRGDQVVLRLKSSDVIHGFSLKDFGIFVTDGIQPGKVMLVSFTANKTGTFTFSCNAICGNNHQNMQGTLIVNA